MPKFPDHDEKCELKDCDSTCMSCKNTECPIWRRYEIEREEEVRSSLTKMFVFCAVAAIIAVIVIEVFFPHSPFAMPK